MTTVAIISNQGFSLVNFRGPLIRELVDKGVRVYALAPDFDDDIRNKIEILGAHPVDICLVRAGMNPWRDTLDAFRLAVILRKLQPDITLGYFIKPVIYGTLAAWMARVPWRVALIEGLGYVYTLPSEKPSLKRKLLRGVVGKLYKIALAKAHRVIFLNDEDISEFLAAGIVKANKVDKIVGIGVDLNEWPLTPPVSKPITFLLAARLLREKGIFEYAAAARLVKVHYPDVRFILLGGLDPNPGGLKQHEVEDWVEQGILEWYGHVNVQPWLALTSVYVLPSYYREGVPRSIQEAMAMGRAIITTDVTGCRETVDDGVNGFLIPARDPKSLAEAMFRFIHEPALIARMGQESRRLAEVRFDVHVINLRFMENLGV